MVQGHQQRVLAAGESHQPPPHQRAPRQVERGRRLGGGDPPQGALRVRLRREVVLAEGEAALLHRRDPLHRNAVHLLEGGAQRLVARNQAVQRPPERHGVHLAAEAEARGEVVGGARPLHPVQEPEPLLGEREGERPLAGDGGDGGERGPGSIREPRREVGQHRAEEEVGHGGVRSERLADAREHPHREQRVPAELEEVVAAPDPLPVENLAPDPRDRLLRLPLRRLAASLLRCLLRGGGERAAVELSGAGEGERLQPQEGRRDHVLRQTGGEVCTERGRRGRLLRVRRGHVVGHQPGLAGAVFPRHHRAGAHRGMGAERILHLPRLDAETADLRLEVDSSQELHRSVGEPAAPVAGSVHPGPSRAGEGVGKEALGGEGRASLVPPRDLRTPHVQLPRHAGGDRPAAPIQEVHLRPGQRAPDGAPGGGVLRQRLDGGIDGGLRGAVGVQQRGAVAAPSEPGGERRDIHRLPADHHQPDGEGDRHRALLQQQLPEAGGDVHHRHAMGGAPLPEGASPAEPGIVAQHQRGAGQEGAEDLHHGHVEGERRELEHPVGSDERQAAAHRRHLCQDGAVLHHHPLGHPRGAGGVDQIRQPPGTAALEGCDRSELATGLRLRRVDQREPRRRSLHGPPRDQRYRPRVAEHRRQPRGGRSRIEGEVGATGL